MGTSNRQHNYTIMVHMFNHWLSKYYVNNFNWDTLPQQIMGILESKPSTQNTSSFTATNTTVQEETHTAANDQQFRDDVRKSAENFKSLVLNNKVMIFSATYCSYCTVVKKTGRDGQMMMDIVEAVTGSRMVPTIFICGQLVPGGGTGLKHLASTGQLSDILSKCCDGDISCKQFDKYSLH